MSNSDIGLYIIRNKENNKIYIGCSIKSVKHRLNEHFKMLLRNKHHSYKLQKDYNKFGKDVFEAYQIASLLEKDKDMIVIIECDLIKEYNSVDSGYNICYFSANPYGRKHSEETKEKKRLLSLSKAKTVLQFDLYDNFICEYTNSTEAAEKLGYSSETINSSCRGWRRSAYGYKWKYKGDIDKSYKVVSEKPKRHPVLQYDLEGNFIKEYVSIAKANEELGLKISNKIGQCCLGYIKQAYGFIWRNKDSNLPIILPFDRKQKTVIQTDLVGSFIQEFENLKAIGIKYNITPNVLVKIKAACIGSIDSYMGFKWKFKD